MSTKERCSVYVDTLVHRRMALDKSKKTGRIRRRRMTAVTDCRFLWLCLLVSLSHQTMGFSSSHNKMKSKRKLSRSPTQTQTQTLTSFESALYNQQGSSSSSRSPRRKKKNNNFPSNKSNNDPESSGYHFWDGELSITSFNMDLQNLAMDDPQKAQDALEIMQNMHLQQPDNPMYVRPNSASYTTVIEGWCYGHIQLPLHADHPTLAAERAQALLDQMYHTCATSNELCPNELSYLYVCQKWSDCYKTDVYGVHAQKAHDILTHMKNEKRNDDHKQNQNQCIQPSVKMYSIVLEGWCRRVGKVRHAMDRAEALLQEMENSGGVVPPNVLTYTSIIGGLARSRKPDLATRADGMLQRMHAHGVEADMVAYTSILNCWAKACSRKEREQASKRALEILNEMEHMYLQEEKFHVKPNAITYATAIKAIGNSLDPNAPVLAEQVLRRMYNLTESGALHVPPNAGTFNAVITSLSTSGPRSQKLANAKRAEHLLVDMIKRERNNEAAVEPNVRTWGAVLRAWKESGQADSGEQAQRVLDQLENWYEEGKSSVRPNVVCYTTVMNAWARGQAKSEVALDKVEALLCKMENVFEETLDIDIRPNKISYVTAIDAFCRKSKDSAASRAQATVDRMMRLYAKGLGHDRPTRIVFNALINAWSRSNEPNAAANAEKIFQWMETQYQGGDECVKPDEVTLCGVLNAWANHAQERGSALRAQQILDHTESLSSEERGFAHSIICHNIVIKAWGRSREPDSVQRAEAILLNLEKRYEQNKENIRPDVTTYSSVINCCAYYTGDERGQREAFEVALRTFRKIEQTDTSEGANHITYGTLFKAIAKLTNWDQEREDLIEKYFSLCSSEGQVDAFVLSQVKNASSSSLFRKVVLGPSSLTNKEESVDNILEKMPKEWKRNVADYGML
jgi:hypothetical protein